MKKIFVFLSILFVITLNGAQKSAKACIEKQLDRLATQPLPTEAIDDCIVQELSHQKDFKPTTPSKTDPLKYQLYLSSNKAIEALKALKKERAHNQMLAKHIAQKQKEPFQALVKTFSDVDLDHHLKRERAVAVGAYQENYKVLKPTIHFSIYLSAEKAFWALSALKKEREACAQLEKEVAALRAAPGGPNPDAN